MMNIPRAKKRRKATKRKKPKKKAIKKAIQKVKKEIEKPMDEYIQDIETKMNKDELKKEMDKSEKQDDEFIWEIHSKEKLFIFTRLEVFFYIGLIIGFHSLAMLFIGIVDSQYIAMYLLISAMVSLGICGLITLYRFIKQYKNKKEKEEND